MSSSLSDLLPEDIVIGIFLRLPAKYLLKLRFVCKYWFNFISSDPRFIKMHLNLRAINEPPLLMISQWHHIGSLRQVLSSLTCSLEEDDNGTGDPQQQMTSLQFEELHGSCNGLLCMETTNENEPFKYSMCLWNPCTKEFKELPDRRPIIFPLSVFKYEYSRVSATYGFGYGSTTEDYKVIRNLCFYGSDENNEQFLETLVEVYTLGSDSWKTIGNYQYELEEFAKGLFVNGGIYWFARKSTTSIDMIICFNIANEDYIEISNPPFSLIKTEYWLSSSSVSPAKLTELKGFLCIINPIREQKCLEVWAMKSEWSKLFTIKEPITALKLEVIGNYMNNGDEILVLVGRKELVLYNPKNDKTRALFTLTGDSPLRRIQTSIESLVSLNSGTYVT